MILPTNISPNKSLYVIGSRIIELLKRKKIIEVQELHLMYNENYVFDKLNYNYFLYALDWLFLLELISINDKFQIKKCS